MSIKVKFFGSLKESMEKTVVEAVTRGQENSAGRSVGDSGDDTGYDSGYDSRDDAEGESGGGSEILSNLSIDGEGMQTALDVWNHVTGNAPVGEQIFCSINLEHSDMDQPVNDGDEVAFFPPVTGG